MMPTDLPPDLAMLSQIVDAESPQVRELFQYALVMLLIENGKAEIIERRTIDGRVWITVRTSTPEIFSIVTPNVDDERLKVLLAAALEVLEEDRSAAVDH